MDYLKKFKESSETKVKFGQTDAYLIVLSIVLIVMASLGLQTFKKGEFKEGQKAVVLRNEKMLQCSLGAGVGILMFVLLRQMIGIKSFIVFGVVIMIISVYTIKQYEEITDEKCKEQINTSYNYMYTLAGLAGAMIVFGMLELYSGEDGLKLPTKNDHLLIVVGCLVVMFIASVSIDTSNRSVNEDPYKMLMVFFLIMAIIVVCIIVYLKVMEKKSEGKKSKKDEIFLLEDHSSESGSNSSIEVD